MSPTRRHLLAGLLAAPALALPKMPATAAPLRPAPERFLVCFGDSRFGFGGLRTLSVHNADGDAPAVLIAEEQEHSLDPATNAAIRRKAAELIGLLEQIAPLDSRSAG